MSASPPAVADQGSHSRRIIRAVLVCIITAWSLATTLPDIALPWHPLSTYGLFHKGGQITNVPRDGPAALAGIKVGDRIDLSATSLNDRRHLYGAVYANSAEPGQPLTLTIDQNGHRRVVTLKSRVLQRTLADNVTNVILVLSQCAMVLIASALVLFRPGVMTWAFYIYSIAGTGLSTLLNAYVPIPLLVTQFGLAYVLSGARAAAFAVFALRFPRDVAKGWKKGLEISLIPVAVALGLLSAYAATAPIVLGHITGGFNAFVAVVNLVVYAIGVAAFIVTYVGATSDDRQRVKWIVVGLIAGFGGSTGFDVIRWLVPSAVSIPLYNSMYSLNVLLPITLAYAIVRNRVIDVNFVISRTVVYAALTAAIVATFALIDWFFSRYLSAASVGTIAEIAVAIGLGFWVNALRQRVNAFVDAVLFRRRHQAETRLQRLARALPHVETIDGIAEGLVDQPAEALELTSAALFMRGDGREYIRIHSAGWHDSNLANVNTGDLLVAQLASERQSIRLHDFGWKGKNLPEGPAAPVLAVPFSVRRELNGFALYGAHVRGGDLDPDEIAIFSELSVGAAAAFDHIEAQTLRKKADHAQERLNALGVERSAPSELPAAPLPPQTLSAQGTSGDPEKTSAKEERSAPALRSRGAFAMSVVAVLLTAYTLVTNVPGLLRPLFPVGTAGVSIDNDDFVTAVERGGPAANAGLAVGDRLDTSDFTTRIIWGWGSADISSAPNQNIPVVFIHAGERRATSLLTHAQIQSLPDAVFGFFGCIIGIFMVLTGLALVLIRPSMMTLGFFAYALALNPASSAKFVASLPPAAIVVYTGWVLLLFLAGNIGVAMFALRFPTDRLSRTGRMLQTVLLSIFIPLSVAYVYYVAVFPLYGITGGRAFSILTYVMTIVAYAVSMAGFIDTYAHASREDRQRIKWVIVGFAIGVAGLIAGFILSDVSLSALSIPAWVAGSANFTAVMIPLTVGYAVIHHRVVDVRFAVSRALVLGVLTASVIALFSVIDWFFGRELSASRLGTVAEIVVALALGFWLNGLHGKVDKIVDVVLFRQRHLAEEHLGRVRRGLPHASTSKAIDEAVVREPVEALKLASAAVFIRADNGIYTRRFELGWEDGTSRALHPDDAIVLQLQGAASPLRLRNVGGSSAILPAGSTRPVVAVPMLVRNQLLGMVLYGPHTSGADLDADELRWIEMLVQSAGSANDHLEAETLREKVKDLSMALAAAGLSV